MSGVELSRTRSRRRSVSRGRSMDKIVEILKDDNQSTIQPSTSSSPVGDLLSREDIPDIYDALLSYISGPVDADVLKRYRADTLRQLNQSTSSKPAGCTFSDDDFMTVIRNISVYFFDGNLLGALFRIRPQPLQIFHDNEDPDAAECNGAPAVYRSRQNAIVQCCPKIEQMKPFLSFLNETPIDDKNLNYTSPEHALISLVEHELTHTLVMNFFYNAKYQQSAHGRTFRLLSRNMFGHGWGDLAAAHLSMFAQNPSRLEHYLDQNQSNFDSEYKTEVLRRLENWRNESFVPLRNSLILGMVCLFFAATLAMMGYRVKGEESKDGEEGKESKNKNKQWLYILLFVLSGVLTLVSGYFLFQARDLVTTQRIVPFAMLIIVGAGLGGGWLMGRIVSSD